ncbi:divergent polysaccharide deacetylase family protein [Shewanella sp. A32]|uniref:divergent polysaccharide deacetylase family protein n=1 Tax=Shewanella sp. A32 TaxID=3031327 RepID=UPI0023B96FAE|nr:divergent polysaccharide deacetylase family protein [Shewanella sp. A32]MDF0535984.1 divergent polysaccharide deacetylase family protein [Shewanella sp. A32]
MAAKLAIIMDDIGYRHTDEAALSLPPGITFSILPHTPLGEKMARAAHAKGHEIMVHIPMQALDGRTMGPGGLNNQMSETQFKQVVEDAIGSIPFAKGTNNHMGSLLTQLDRPMGWLMSVLKQQNLYFVDSVTTRYTKAGDEAETHDVPLLKRQVFLDNQTSLAALKHQLKEAVHLARKEGQVVLIAHPYPETIAFLKKQLKQLPEEGVQLVHASSLLPLQLAQKADMATEAKEQL